ncbi:MAG: anion transporter [Gammaproteobacteria bacterium]|nr:anion transporter [Gammaproteobacteria bacterium]
MEFFVVIVFLAVYVGMAAGRVPQIGLDRTGMALAGVAALLVGGALDFSGLVAAIDWPTLLLLFALMLIAGYFIAAGGFVALGAKLGHARIGPRGLLALVTALAGVLSMMLVNDIVVFSLVPVLVALTRARGLDARPYLLACAMGANGGSAATLIGNPQNILIGEIGGLDFLGYLAFAAVPALVCLSIVCLIVARVWRAALLAPDIAAMDGSSLPIDRSRIAVALAAVILVVLGMAFGGEQRAIIVLGIAVVLMLDPFYPTPKAFAQVDGSLLVLIASLFAVTATLGALPATGEWIGVLEQRGLLHVSPSGLAGFALVAGNTIGNVPAVVLLLSVIPELAPEVLRNLALFATLAGNLLLTGSLANIIVAERARQNGVWLGFGDFARVGIPVTLSALVFAVLWTSVVGR